MGNSEGSMVNNMEIKNLEICVEDGLNAKQRRDYVKDKLNSIGIASFCGYYTKDEDGHSMIFRDDSRLCLSISIPNRQDDRFMTILFSPNIINCLIESQLCITEEEAIKLDIEEQYDDEDCGIQYWDSSDEFVSIVGKLAQLYNGG